MSKDIELKNGIKYHYANDEVDAKFITISAYSMKQMHLAAPVKEIVMKSMAKLVADIEITAADAEAAKASAKEDSENVDSSQLLMMVAMNCGEGDYGKLLLHMQKLLISGVAYLDASDVKFSGTHIDKMSPSDFEILCGEYIGNFIT